MANILVMLSRLIIIMGCMFVLFPHSDQAQCLKNKKPILNCTGDDVLPLYDQINNLTALWKKTRPVLNQSDMMYIKMGFTINAILGVNEKDGLLTMFMTRTLDWYLPFLSWDDESCKIKTISYPMSDVWLPDVQIMEFMEEDKSPVTPYLQINCSGGVHVVERKRIVSTCNMNIYKFPFDTQQCTLTFSSVLHEENVLNLTSKSSEYILKSSNVLMKANQGWILINVTQMNTCYNLTSTRFYSAMVYNITLKREPCLYVVNLLVPSFFLSMLDLFSFYLPPENVDRSAFKMTLILGYTVFLIITNDIMPNNSAETPLINVVFSMSMSLMVISLLQTMLIVNLYSRGSNYHRKVPRWLSRLVLHYLARLFIPHSDVCPPATLTTKKEEKGAFYLEDTLQWSAKTMVAAEAEQIEMTKEATIVNELQKLAREVLAIRQKVETHLSPTQDVDEWKMIAKITDRLLFLFYVIFVVVSYITILALWAA